jgi:hypothetical protein
MLTTMPIAPRHLDSKPASGQDTKSTTSKLVRLSPKLPLRSVYPSELKPKIIYRTEVDTRGRLKRMALDRGTSVNGIIDGLVLKALDRHERKANGRRSADPNLDGDAA